MLNFLSTPKNLVSLLAVMSLLFIVFKGRVQFIDPLEAKRYVQEGALLIDVRTAGEFEQNHIKGAINIPVDQVSARLSELGTPNQQIVVYCRSGARSAKAQSIMNDGGFKHVYNLGGLSQWPK